MFLSRRRKGYYLGHPLANVALSSPQIWALFLGASVSFWYKKYFIVTLEIKLKGLIDPESDRVGNRKDTYPFHKCSPTTYSLQPGRNNEAHWEDVRTVVVILIFRPKIKFGFSFPSGWSNLWWGCSYILLTCQVHSQDKCPAVF